MTSDLLGQVFSIAQPNADHLHREVTHDQRLPMMQLHEGVIHHHHAHLACFFCPGHERE